MSAWRRLEAERAVLFTTHVVVVETLTLVARALGSKAAAELGRVILGSRSLTVVRPSADDDSETLDELERFAEHRIGYADCLSFATMRGLRIERAFTFDRRHFGIAGFTVFP